MKRKMMSFILAVSLTIGSSMIYSCPVLAAEQADNEVSSERSNDISDSISENDIASEQNVQKEQDKQSENTDEIEEALQNTTEENANETNIDALEANGNSLEEENTNTEYGQDGLTESVHNEDSSENLTTESENQEEVIDESELKENSWRYQNGERINIEGTNQTRAVPYPYAWEKVNGKYVNTKGEVIPNAVKKGIDVSEHNGTINWEKVKSDGIEFAIIRCGYGSDYTEQDDKQWLRNVSECERLGIPYGVYLYSYADTLQKAESEARHVLRLLQGHSPFFPIYYDLEDKLVEKISSSMKGQIAQIFCDKISAAGYKVGIYSNLNWWTNFLTDSAFNNTNWSKWVAQYNSTCDYTGEYDMWQCTSVGQVEGIKNENGNTDVDLNFWLDASAFDGLQYNVAANNWYMYKNGMADTSYTGLASNANGWWYVRNGAIDWDYTGFAQNENGWWYVRNGGIDWNYTSVEFNGSEWWYVKNGEVDWNYTGVAQNANGWWYVKNGEVDWDYTGLASNSNGWWYIKDGGVDWNYTGFAENEYGMWYVRGGGIDWNYTSVEYTGNAWLYVENGGVNWNYTGLASNSNGWWYIKKGQVDWKHTGLESNANGWWYVKDGGIDWNFTGVVQNAYGWWYVSDGGVDWNYTGSVKYNGKTYSVVGGEVMV